jgi:hypothetical protein
VFFLNRSYSYYALKNLEKAKTDAIKAANAGAGIPPAYAQSLGL